MIEYDSDVEELERRIAAMGRGSDPEGDRAKQKALPV